MSQKEDFQTYEVEKIVGRRIHHGILQYKVHWLGYDTDEDSWENIEDLNCPDLIEKYNSESMKSNTRTGLKENLWEKATKTNPPIRIINSLKFCEDDYLRVQLKDGTYATFSVEFIKTKYPNIQK